MIVRFLAPNGSPQRALDYVHSSHDEWGREREVTLVAGSPTAFLAATRDLAFTRPYQSCVLAWSAGDSPSVRQLDQVLDCLLNAMACGLPLHRLAYAALRHDRAGSTDVHVLVSAVDLGTGKHHNPAPPGWQKLYGLLQDWANEQFGWTSPLDEERQRWIQPARPSYLHWAAGTPSVKHVIVETAQHWIETQVVTCRATLIQRLQAVAGLYVVGVADGRLRLIFEPGPAQDNTPVELALQRCAVTRPVRFQLSGQACRHVSQFELAPRPALGGPKSTRTFQDDKAQEEERRRRQRRADLSLFAMNTEIERLADKRRARRLAKGRDLTTWPDNPVIPTETPLISNFEEHRHGSETNPFFDFPLDAGNRGPIRTGFAEFVGAAIQRLEQFLERFGEKVGHLQSGVEELARWISSRRRAGAQRARAFLQGSTPGADATTKPQDKDDAIPQSTRIPGVGRR